MFAYPLASKPCSETTNMPYWGQWLLCCGWKDELNSNNIFVERDQKTRYTIK